ncbi:forkhead box D1 [Paramuricea clavata]|uniref:Forkhead box D1 n=1 Tax=Paramuricea clavata TaxID=317549 RepID=A0A7D9HCM7_PARCT|nr:forkhead box D1 [Paramuricea clavata]
MTSYINDSNLSSSHHNKPPLSYIALITLAIKNSPLQMATLNEVYQYIIANFPYFQENRQKWQNTVRHNLSLNDCFVKIPRRLLGIPGKGNFWALHPQAGGMFNHGSLLRRRRRFRSKTSSRSKSSPGYEVGLGRNPASIHHIDSKHHFDLYGAQNDCMNFNPDSIDLTTEGVKMLYRNYETQDRSLVPSPQYPPLSYHTLYGWNVLPNYSCHMNF